MPSELFARYAASPLVLDAEVRQQLKVPPTRYYSVSVWPPERAGRVQLTLPRSVAAHKISKSDQPSN